MRKSTKLSFEKTFVELYKKGWNSYWFGLNKSDGNYLLNNDFLDAKIEDDNIWYTIASEDAWNQLLEIYSDKIRELKYYSEFKDLLAVLHRRYSDKIHRIAYRDLGVYARVLSLNEYDLYVVVNNQYFKGDENLTMYLSSISSIEELADISQKYMIYHNWNKELNLIYEEFKTEFETEKNKLKEKYGIE